MRVIPRRHRPPEPTTTTTTITAITTTTTVTTVTASVTASVDRPKPAASTRGSGGRRRPATAAAVTVVLATAITVLVLLSVPGPAAAADAATVLAAPPASVNQVLANIRTWIVGLLAGLATLFLTLGAVRYLMANGDPGEIAKAKEAFRGAGIGYGGPLSTSLGIHGFTALAMLAAGAVLSQAAGREPVGVPLGACPHADIVRELIDGTACPIWPSAQSRHSIRIDEPGFTVAAGGTSCDDWQ